MKSDSRDDYRRFFFSHLEQNSQDDDEDEIVKGWCPCVIQLSAISDQIHLAGCSF